MQSQHFNLSRDEKEKVFDGVPFIDQVIAYLDYLRNDARDSQVIKFLGQEEFEKNPEFLLGIVEHRPYFYPSMPWKFKVDMLFVNAYLNSKEPDIKEIPENVFQDRKLVNSILDKDGLFIGSMPPEIKFDRECIKRAVSCDGLAISLYLDPDVEYSFPDVHHESANKNFIRNDKEIAMLAIRQTRSAFAHLSKNLQNDDDILRNLIRSMNGPEFNTVGVNARIHPTLLIETLARFPDSFGNLMRGSNIKDKEELWEQIKASLKDKPEEFFTESFNNFKFIGTEVSLFNLKEYLGEVLSHISLPTLQGLRKNRTVKDVSTPDNISKFDVLDNYILEKHNDVLREKLSVLSPSVLLGGKKKVRKMNT